jgi:hypothetical protein
MVQPSSDEDDAFSHREAKQTLRGVELLIHSLLKVWEAEQTPQSNVEQGHQGGIGDCSYIRLTQDPLSAATWHLNVYGRNESINEC